MDSKTTATENTYELVHKMPFGATGSTSCRRSSHLQLTTSKARKAGEGRYDSGKIAGGNLQNPGSGVYELQQTPTRTGQELSDLNCMIYRVYDSTSAQCC